MEEDNKLPVCRLCFNVISDKSFCPIEGSLKDMLQFIASNLDLDITDYPIMCSECSKTLQEAFNFKTNFFETEEKIESKIAKAHDAHLDLVDIMTGPHIDRLTRSSASTKLDKTRLCRTCLKTIEGETFIVVSKDVDMYLCTILETCLPELNLSLTANPVMCQTCYDVVQKIDVFKTACIENENKVKLFKKHVGKEMQEPVNLHRVLQYSLNSESSDNCKDIPEYVLIKAEVKQESEHSGLGPSSEQGEKINESRLSRSTVSGDGNEESLTQCSDCNFKTKYKYNLRRHLIVAHKRKDVKIKKKFYPCPQCDFSTKWNIDLTRHMLSHVKPEVLHCTRCPYSTNQNSQLIKHILSHVNPSNMGKYSFLQLNKKTK